MIYVPVSRHRWYFVEVIIAIPSARVCSWWKKRKEKKLVWQDLLFTKSCWFLPIPCNLICHCKMNKRKVLSHWATGKIWPLFVWPLLKIKFKSELDRAVINKRENKGDEDSWVTNLEFPKVENCSRNIIDNAIATS